MLTLLQTSKVYVNTSNNRKERIGQKKNVNDHEYGFTDGV